MCFSLLVTNVYYVYIYLWDNQVKKWESAIVNHKKDDTDSRNEGTTIILGYIIVGAIPYVVCLQFIVNRY